MSLKSVSYYLAAPDGSCFIYPEDQLPCKIEQGYWLCIDKRMFEVERIIPYLSEEPAEQWVLWALKKMRGLQIPKFLNMGPKETLVLGTNRAVLVLLKDLESTRTPRVSLHPEARLVGDGDASTDKPGNNSEKTK